MHFLHFLPLLAIGVLGKDFIFETRTSILVLRDTTPPDPQTYSYGPGSVTTDPPWYTGTYPTTDGWYTLGGPLTSISSTTASPTTTTPPPSCSMQNEDPDQAIYSAYCVCDGSTLPLLSVASTAMATEECDYKSIPKTSTIKQSTGFGPAVTNSALCQVCTRVVVNEDDCTTIPNCIPQAAVATISIGSTPIHVGTLTGTALYTAVSTALESICPSVTQTTSLTKCSGSASIPHIAYVADNNLADDGDLVINADGSGYNLTSLRDAMIRSTALAM